MAFENKGFDLAFDLATYDLFFNAGDLRFTTDEDKVIQNIRTVVSFVRGEWFLDSELGLPYYEEFFVKNPNFAEIESVFKRAVLQVENVNSLIEWQMTFERDTRILTIRLSVDTTFGPLSARIEL